MFRIRKRHSINPQRQLLPMQFEAMVEHEHLPPALDGDWSKRWCTVSNDFEENYDRVFNFKVRADDVFVVTGTKSGTTWMLEAAWLLMNNLDYESAKEIPTGLANCLELSAFYKKFPLDTIELCNQMPSPRLFKSHLPVSLLPKQCWEQKTKIIYVARNFKDFVVSSYNFNKGIGWWTGTIDEFVEDIINNEIMYTPFLMHMLEFWKLRHEPHICFVTYEEMKRDLAGVLQKLCKFLERKELTTRELQETVDFLSFDNMKKNCKLTTVAKQIFMEATADFQFMRRGIVGSYKDELSPELQEKLNKWSEEFLAKYNIKEEDIFGIV